MSISPRLLLCCEHYPPSVGGVQEVMRQIAERLAAEGLEVTVATSPHPQRSLDTVRNGVRVVSFDIVGNWAKGMTGQIEEYRSFLRHGKFDAVLIKAAQQWTFDAAMHVLPEMVCRKLFIPCGFSGLRDPFYSKYFQQMPEWLRRFDGLIFYSNEYQDIAFARAHGIKSLHLIPNGVDEREFQDPEFGEIRQRLGIDVKDDLIIGVGSRIATKGHWEVVRAFRKANLNRPATLVINANSPGNTFAGSVKRHLKHALTGRLPLPWVARWYNLTQKFKRVLVVDLSRADVVSLYKSADLFVMASHVEYSPLVLFEAAAAGTPFVASDAGNSQEIARWTRGGVVVPRGKEGSAMPNINALVQEIENMLSDKEKLNAIGQMAKITIWNEGFTWQKIVLRYRNLLIP